MVSILTRIYKHLSAQRRMQLLLVLLLMLLGALAEIFTLGAVVPFLGLLVNPDVLDKQPGAAVVLDGLATLLGTNRLVAASVLFAAFAAAAAALRLFLSWASLRFVFAVGADFGEAIYRLTLQQSYAYHLARNSSQTLAAVDKVTVLVMGVMVQLMQLFIAGLMVVAILGAMLWVNPGVAVGAGLVFGVLYAGISLWAKRSLQANSHISAVNGTLKIKALQEGLGAIRDVIIDGNHGVYVAQFAEADRAQRKAQAMNLVLAGAPKYVVESIGMVLIVFLAMYLVSGPGGAADAMPVLGALALGAQRILPYMQNIYSGLASIDGNRASAEESLDLLSLPPSVDEELRSAVPLKPTGGLERPLVELRNVSFSYNEGGPEVLRDVCLSIARGARVGLTGKTGSGKSSLIDLLMGLLPATTGQVLIDGQALTSSNLRAWQDRIAHVPQAIFLADTSIAQNIALGVPPHAIDAAQLARVMEIAQMIEFVARLPQGVETRVGERGVQLSGGQRQRIGIARALYKRAEVLVLDEATSALDTETEARLMDAIYRLNPDIVIVMIAHRVSTLSQCHVVYRMADGVLRDAEPISRFG